MLLLDARRGEPPQAATLSLAAARQYGMTVESYALFANTTAGLVTYTYPSDLDDADAVEAWALRQHEEAGQQPEAAGREEL